MYCVKCGKELPSDAQFCVYCGAKVAAKDIESGSVESKFLDGKTNKVKYKRISFLLSVLAVVCLVVGIFIYTQHSNIEWGEWR